MNLDPLLCVQVYHDTTNNNFTSIHSIEFRAGWWSTRGIGWFVGEEDLAWLASPLVYVLSTAMSEQQEPSSVAQQIIFKFFTNEGIKPSEILTILSSGALDCTRNHAFTYKGGRDGVENEIHVFFEHKSNKRLYNIVNSTCYMHYMLL